MQIRRPSRQWKRGRDGLKDVILELVEDLLHDCQISEYGLGTRCGEENILI